MILQRYRVKININECAKNKKKKSSVIIARVSQATVTCQHVDAVKYIIILIEAAEL